MVRRHLCILLVELQRCKRGLSPEETGRILHTLDGTKYQRHEVESTVREMVDKGSRYINLENFLGLGVLFVLGQGISETW